jgi:ParB family transcriptional regulator, chromosome partitioning protein
MDDSNGYPFELDFTFSHIHSQSRQGHHMARTKIELAPSTEATTPLDLSAGPSKATVSAILLRKSADTRHLNAAHVVMLAESISILGLLEPIIIDSKGHLLAGGHRLAAIQLLSIADSAKRKQAFLDRTGYKPVEGEKTPKELEALAGRVADSLDADGFASRYPKAEIPIVVVDVSGKDSKTLPLAIEAAENNVRRQYSADEIKALAERYQEAGFKVSSGGRPTKGSKTVMNALEAALGRSKRQIQRILQPTKGKRGKTEWDKILATLSRVAKRTIDAGSKKEGDEDKAVVAAAERLAKAVEKALG